ncbi:DUF2397 domain-containing protein [Alkalihalobacillus oceani]|nr:DUF2397 domain-containing protein [Halalkalibacter oceani]
MEEFKQKRFYFQATPYTIEFERMLVRLEEIASEFPDY